MMPDFPIGTGLSTYTLTTAEEGHSVFCRVTGTNASGSAFADSNLVGPIGAASMAPSAPAATNLYSWVKADAGVFSDYTMATPAVADGEVLGWQDQKGSANKNWLNTTPGNGPVLKTGVVNGKPVLRFTATPSPAKALLNDFDATGLTAHEIFVVVKAVTNSPIAVNGSVSWTLCGSGENSIYPFYADGNIYEGWGSTTRKSFAHPSHDVAAWHLLNLVSIAGEYTVFVDGTQIYTTATNTAGMAAYASGTLGGFDGAAFNGDIAEIVWYSAKCSAPDKSTTKTYLAGKYGLTVV